MTDTETATLLTLLSNMVMSPFVASGTITRISERIAAIWQRGVLRCKLVFRSFFIGEKPRDKPLGDNTEQDGNS